jgi:hypothetical protein
MPEDVLFACLASIMSECENERSSGLELLLREPEIVAWLDDYRRPADEDDEDGGGEPPRAA